MLSGLAEWDLPDIYRGLHGYGVAEASWVHRRGAALRGRRFDHVFAARALEATRCAYLHDLRERGLSDHSALEADFRWPTCLV